MNEPRITVITVVYNAVSDLERTIQSVTDQKYQNIEYIVIDGGSTDGTLDVIKKYQDKISFWVSEKDKGIYDAMNKGIRKATGEWLNFMNSGDVFNNNEVLRDVFNQDLPLEAKFLYSDFMVEKNEKYKTLLKASFDEGIVLHQSAIYKKELHSEWGLYVVTPRIIISDYLFFNAIPKEQIYKIDTIISLNSASGVSSGDWCTLQKLALDYIFYRISFMGIFRKAFMFKLRKWTKKVMGKKMILAIQVLTKSGTYYSNNK